MPERHRTTPHALWGWVSALPALGFLGVFLLYPILMVWPQAKSPQSFGAVLLVALQNPYWQGRLQWTLWQAVLSTALCVALGVGSALVLRHQFAGRAVLLAILTWPFVVPVVVVGMGFGLLFGTRGVFGVPPGGDATLIVLANVFYNHALVLRLVLPRLETLPTHTLEAARTLGSTPWRAFWRVTLPSIRGAVVAAASLVFLYCFASFGVPLVLGGGKFNTLELEIYQLVSTTLDVANVCALAFVQWLVCLLVVVAYSRTPQPASDALTFVLPRLQRRAAAWAVLQLGAMLCLTLGPLVAVVLRAFSETREWARAFQTNDGVFSVSPWVAIGNSLGFAALALPVALLVAFGFALGAYLTRSRFLDALIAAPMTVSGVLLSVAYLLALPAWRANLILLIAAYVMGAYPLLARALLVSLRALPLAQLEAARGLGSGPWRVLWRVVLPALQPALRSGLALALAVILGEFGATLVLSRPEWVTLSGLVYQKLGRPGMLGQASVLAVVLLLLVALGFWALGFGARPQKAKR